MEKFIDVLTFYAIFKGVDFAVSVTVKTALRIKSEREFLAACKRYNSLFPEPQ